MTRLKYLAEVIAGQSPPSGDVDLLGEGQPFLQGNAEFGPTHPTPRYECSAPRKQCMQGDILLSVRAPVGAVNVADQAYGIGRGLCAIRAHAAAPAYLRWWLEHSRADLEALATGSTFSAVSAPVVGGLEVPNVSVSQQGAIADYLHCETARIDTLIEEQQHLIDMLRERRGGVVSHAVLESTAKRTALRRVVDVIDCAHVTATFVDDDERFPVASIRECQGAIVDLSECNFTTAEFFGHLRASDRAPRAGDLLFIRNVSVGLVAAVAPGTPEFAIGQETVLLRRKTDVDPAFLRYALTSAETRHAIEAAMIGSTFTRINVSAIRGLMVPVPPLDEQRRIAGYLDEQIAKIDELVAETKGFIELARERRSALITAAVTGQIDVRAVA